MANQREDSVKTKNNFIRLKEYHAMFPNILENVQASSIDCQVLKNP